MRKPTFSSPFGIFLNAALFAILGFSGLISSSPEVHAQTKKIIFLSGPKDHGWPGRHEYVKSLELLGKALEESPNAGNIEAEFYVGPAPRDPKIYEDADAIVVLSSSDRSANEIHPLFPPEPTTFEHSYDYETKEFLKMIDDRVKNGMGIVILHYAVWVEHWTAREYFMNWTGGLWVQIPSKNPNDDWKMVPEKNNHPILNGVEPWEFKEEIFSRFFLPPNMPARTPLVIGTPSRSDIGPVVTAWAYQPTETQRAFVFGGIDYHDNLYMEEHRQFILNGIAWAAGINIPNDGIQSTVEKENE